MTRFIHSIIFLATIFIISSCSKNENKVIEQEKVTTYESTATIIGQDMALCACCGDWQIIIDNMVYPANTLLPFVHQFKFLPGNSTINLSTATFPLNVKINWSIDNNTCYGNGRIVIDDIALN